MSNPFIDCPSPKECGRTVKCLFRCTTRLAEALHQKEITMQTTIPESVIEAVQSSLKRLGRTILTHEQSEKELAKQLAAIRADLEVTRTHQAAAQNWLMRQGVAPAGESDV